MTYFFGGFFFLLSSLMLARAIVLIRSPDHRITRRVQERNLRWGIETDMNKWGRKVFRRGLILLAISLAFFAYAIFGSAGDIP